MENGFSRRSFVAGVAPLALLAVTRSAPAISSSIANDRVLIGLGRDLTVMRRRAARLKRAYVRFDSTDDPGAPAYWQKWSQAIDDCGRLTKRIRRIPATSLGGMVVKLDALIFDLCDADLGDEPANPIRARLLTAQRELTALAKANATNQTS